MLLGVSFIDRAAKLQATHAHPRRTKGAPRRANTKGRNTQGSSGGTRTPAARQGFVAAHHTTLKARGGGDGGDRIQTETLACFGRGDARAGRRE